MVQGDGVAVTHRDQRGCGDSFDLGVGPAGKAAVERAQLVQQALQTILRDRTAVIIAHRLSTVEIADRVLVMEHGRIVEDGSPAELIAGESGRYSDLHDAWLASLA